MEVESGVLSPGALRVLEGEQIFASNMGVVKGANLMIAIKVHRVAQIIARPMEEGRDVYGVKKALCMMEVCWMMQIYAV